MHHREKGITTVGVMISVGLAVLIGGGFWLAAQLLSSSENLSDRAPTLLYSQECGNSENLNIIAVFDNPAPVPPTSPLPATRWQADLNIGLREDVFRADFNKNGDISDIIKRNMGVNITSPVNSTTTMPSNSDHAELVYEGSPPLTSGHIGIDESRGCWGWTPNP